MTDKEVIQLEPFEFADNQQGHGGQINIKAPVFNEQLTEQQIQQEIMALSKQTKSPNRDIPFFPSLDKLDDTFDEFAKNKAYSFLLLSFHPYFIGKFDQNDIKEIYSQSKQRGQSQSYLNFFTIICMYTGCENLFKKSALFGLTYKTGFINLFFRYYFIPKLITNIADEFIFYARLKRNTNSVLQKYNYDQELKTNPLYKKAFEDFKLFQKTQSNSKYNQVQQ